MRNTRSVCSQKQPRSAFLSVFLVFTLIFLPLLSYARHIIGGEMTYRFVMDLGNGIKRYEFTLVVYRDCDSGGGQLDSPARIGIYKGSATSAQFEAGLNATLTGPVTVQPVIPPCADGSAVSNACVQRGVYTFTRDLADLPNQSYFIVYQRCCRTDQIINIQTPGEVGATYMVEITPAAQVANNNSPIFVNYPATFICNNLLLDFDHSATDVDGDSLVYSLCTPLTGGGQGGGNGCNSPTPNPPCGPPFDMVDFAGVYNMANPMGGNPAISIDPKTGKLSGRPTILGQYVVGICVQEYRNGQLIGTVLRDFQFNVVDCTPTVSAQISSSAITGPKQFLVKRCGQKVVTILNQSPQTPDLFSWQWEVDLNNGSVFSSNAWHLTVVLPDYGTYTARLYLNRYENCKDTAFITLIAFPGVKANYSFDWDVCKETPVTFSDSSVSGATTGGIVSRVWVFGTTGDSSKLLNPVYQFPAYGQYQVKLFVADSDGCADLLTQTVDWAPQLLPPINDPGILRVCMPEPIDFPLFDTIPLGANTVFWDFGDGKTETNNPSPKHFYSSPGTYTASVSVKNAFDCFVTDTFVNQVIVDPKPVADFAYLPELLSNLNNTAYFQDKSDSSALQWRWEFGSFSYSTKQNPIHVFASDTGFVPVTLRVFNAEGCSDTITRVLDITPKVRLYVPNVFAPLSDTGLRNDRFGLLGILPGYSDFNMRVWSRWGELLFESTDPENGWDGRRNRDGKVMPVGVYVYQITLKGPRGEPLRFEGTISLL